MTFRISQIAAVCGLSLLTMPGAMYAQAPRYQSPIGTPTPAAPQPQPAALPGAAAVTPNGVVVEDMIVRVNDQIISRSDLERSQQQLEQEMQQNNVPPAEAAESEKNLLRDMIDKQLMLSRAKELGLNADAEVVRRLDEIRKQYKLDTMEDLEKAARQQGISFEDFKANIRDGILEQQVVRDEVGRRLQMTQGQEQAYYDAHKQDFTQPEQIRLSEILIPTAADANDAAVAEAQAKANDVAAQIKAGAKFDELAKKVSGGPTAAQGGDLGQFKRGALAKVLEDQTFGLAAGQSTEPIRTRQGFVILKVTEHQAAGVQPLKDVEPQVQEAMYMEQLQPAMRTYLTKLREDAYIDIKPGFVDTGASPKQTKPIMTAYTAPVPKKKTVVEKQRFDRGGRFSTAEPKSAGAAAPAAAGAATSSAAGSAVSSTTVASAEIPTAPTPAATSSAKTVSSTKATTSGKPKKIKREKVRYGQAPRNSLPSSPTDTLTDKGLGLSAAEGPGGAAAPGASMAPGESTTTFTASSDPDPLTPKVASTGKVRYSSRAKTEAATKAANKTAKAQDKAKATPVAETSEEKLAEKTQAAPLGLNGDTAKKKKKEKSKDTPKERIQEKPKEPAAPAPEPTPYRTPPPPTTPASAPPADAVPPAAPATAPSK